MDKYGKNPFYGMAWKLVRRTGHLADVDFLRPLYSVPTPTTRIHAEIEQLQKELSGFQELRKTLQAHKQFIDVDFDAGISDRTVWLPLLYYLIRIKKPKVVVETGCATGTTTALILYALAQNQTGHLHSIDLRFPSDWLSLKNLPTGFLVPEDLKTRWTLTLCDAKIALPELLHQLGHVDFFYHDSDHSYVHQAWEYLTAWPYLTPSGILASDDLADNAAWFDFARQIRERNYITRRQRNFGYIIKEAHAPSSS